MYWTSGEAMVHSSMTAPFLGANGSMAASAALDSVLQTAQGQVLLLEKHPSLGTLLEGAEG